MLHFGTQFTAGKPEILLKDNISEKATSLRISNNVSPRSKKNQKILVKLKKKEFNIIGTFIYMFRMPNFSFCVFVVSTLPRKTTMFLGSEQERKGMKRKDF